MSQQMTSPLKTYFDELEETNGDDECREWLNKLSDVRAELATLVATRREGGGIGTYIEILKAPSTSASATLSTMGDRIPSSDSPSRDTLLQRTGMRSPHNLGPFIIVDYVTGTLLSTILKQPDEEDLYLNPNIDNTLLDKIYFQIARYLLQISHLTFPKIGAISKNNTSNTWHVPNRPLTYSMNELRNLADDPDIAQNRSIARHRFKQLISKYYSTENEPFILFCDDMRPSNMLIDPRMEQFLRALARVEREIEYNQPGHLSLSARMRGSWSTGRLWFDYAARKSFDVDIVYWATLHSAGTGIEELDEKARAELEPLKRMKMEQLKAYKEECSARFSSDI
ncbi:hypothetical protein BO85DRAFT_473530 [Aspergillus piperis CBS 112811]|uniref:Aminoglycoside phosphotransferase domain-containing protein n=1 Tax=Aspergillus piperis CBS 112811 TaxID=1448313 RepID=A0A8G1VRA3_9EURO|nr:hypothetical protein BO85DRAFT_473530 [Aspergillus piperis CBS 112811]RAH62854.1 hypothetical protein BO85DRAFT_473530 [Aspergillus piperis CBS 112811]